MSARAARKADVTSGPTVGDRIGTAQRKLALVTSAGVNFQQRGDRDVNIDDLFDGILDAVRGARLELHRIEACHLEAVMKTAAPDQLDREGVEVIAQAEALVDDTAEAEAAEDRRLLAAVMSARHEGNSFTEIHQAVATVNGVVEVLYQMIDPSGEPPDDVNWTVVCDLLEDARRRLGPVYSATNELCRYERETGHDGGGASAARGA